MGYHYSDSLKNEHRLKLVESFNMMLKRENCASTRRLVKIIECGRFQLISSENEDNKLRFFDEENEIVSISFPAILDLKGNHTRIQSFPFNRNEESVSFSFYTGQRSSIFFLPLKFRTRRLIHLFFNYILYQIHINMNFQQKQSIVAHRLSTFYNRFIKMLNNA